MGLLMGTHLPLSHLSTVSTLRASYRRWPADAHVLRDPDTNLVPVVDRIPVVDRAHVVDCADSVAMRITATVLTTSSPGPSWTSRSGLLAGVAFAVAAAGNLADNPRPGFALGLDVVVGLDVVLDLALGLERTSAAFLTH
jgi:hypothetical protein